MQLVKQRNKKIGIFGLGKTGIAAYKALKDNAHVICYDDNLNNREEFSRKFGNTALVDTIGNKWQELDKIVLSPGVSQSHQIVKLAQEKGIEITSDIELLYEEYPKASYICITGTNGKSTTTALIGHILNICGLAYPVGGNIGVAALDLPPGKEGYVLELSSFQLDLTKKIKPKVSILLNITPDHIDRHGSMENYIKAKERIFTNLDSDSFGVFAIDNEITNQLYQKYLKLGKFKCIPVSVKELPRFGVYVADNVICEDIFAKKTLSMPDNQFLQGAHNRENIAAAYATCRLLGIRQEKVIPAIATFQGLPHRMQYLGCYLGTEFFNDSKATNAEAASKSISALENIYWLAGGVAKEGGIASLQSLFNNIKKAYLFGQDKELFAQQLKGKVIYETFLDLPSAFSKLIEDIKHVKSSSKRSVLLAPAAASLDQFKNFEHRGEVFIKLVTEFRKELK